MSFHQSAMKCKHYTRVAGGCMPRLCVRLSLPRLPPAPHAGAAERRARAGPTLSRNRFHAGAHLVERRLAGLGAVVCSGPVRRDFVMERNTHFVERGLVDFRLTSPRVRGEVVARSEAGEGAFPRF